MKIFILLCYGVSAANGQTLLKSVPASHARSIGTDELGNVYLVRQDNSLVRYNNNGDSTGNYRSIQNGDIGWVDATNPLRVLVYFPDYMKIVVLDRMLTSKNELDLKQLNLYNVPAVGMSADGKIWVYDYVNARLSKMDDQLNTTNISNDLRQETATVPQPASLIERDAKVYLCDSVNGIYVFDRFGNYINTLDLRDVGALQVFGSQLIYQKQGKLYAYDLKTLSLKSINLPPNRDFIQARVERNRLFLLFADRLELYQTEE
ncbi:MAG: hypothetical protein QM642_00935 [Edaphocola sp.]